MNTVEIRDVTIDFNKDINDVSHEADLNMYWWTRDRLFIPWQNNPQCTGSQTFRISFIVFECYDDIHEERLEDIGLKHANVFHLVALAAQDHQLGRKTEVFVMGTNVLDFEYVGFPYLNFKERKTRTRRLPESEISWPLRKSTVLEEYHSSQRTLNHSWLVSRWYDGSGKAIALAVPYHE